MHNGLSLLVSIILLGILPTWDLCHIAAAHVDDLEAVCLSALVAFQCPVCAR